MDGCQSDYIKKLEKTFAKKVRGKKKKKKAEFATFRLFDPTGN